MTVISVKKSVTDANDRVAQVLRTQFLFHGIWVLNLISAPGAGKTALIEKTIEGLGSDFGIGVIEGDPHTCLDSERIHRAGAEAIQINTRGGCHLDAIMIENALGKIHLPDIDLLFIENVGNLLCPAVWDLGQDCTAVVSSLTEGGDKPFKYPDTFARADLLLINKMDLLPHLPGSASLLKPNALKIHPGLTVFEISCTNGTGLLQWYDWIRTKVEQRQKTGGCRA